MENDGPIQTRSTTGELKYFPTLRRALDAAEIDSNIWKISFAINAGERCRLIRDSGEWVLRQMDEAVAQIIADERNRRCPL